MSELKSLIEEKLKKHPIAVLATVTPEGLPWCRYVMISSDGDMTLRFASFLSSRKVAHIRNNPNVHLTCGVSTMQDMESYLQISGTAEIFSDEKSRHDYWKAPLKMYFEGPDDPDYCVVVIKPSAIEHVSKTTETLYFDKK